MNTRWQLKSFEELTNKELYGILKLRAEVFIVEQNCAYQDLDGKDLKSFHLMGYNSNNELIAFSRILPPNISYPEVSIGRVVSSPNVRTTGIGKELMTQTLEEIKNKFGNVPIKISAQCYLKKFYEAFNFIALGEEYLEDDIPHIEMIRN